MRPVAGVQFLVGFNWVFEERVPVDDQLVSSCQVIPTDPSQLGMSVREVFNVAECQVGENAVPSRGGGDLEQGMEG